MPALQYINRRFGETARYIIRTSRAICAAEAAEGYDLTLRQLYYQFVARDLFPEEWTWSWTGTRWVKDANGTKNAEPNYKKLGSIVNDARLAGMLDWNFIVDRTRRLEGPGSEYDVWWDSPDQIIRASARGYQIDKWAKQEFRVEAWIEKDALKGVLESACPELDISFFSCRGYSSQSAIWQAAQRIENYINAGQKMVILHLGDHDPSGIDMTRDIEERLAMFIAQDMDLTGPDDEMDAHLYEVSEYLTVDRIALNMDQIRHYNPPPNPAKLTDARAQGYIERFGESSWELDALGTSVLADLVRAGAARYRDDDVWEDAVDREAEERKILTATHERWGEVKKFLTTTEKEES